jgi:hypothetical protein
LLWTYFEQSRRFHQALAFFTPMLDYVPGCALRVALAQRELGALSDAIGTLASSLAQAPGQIELLLEQVALLLQCDMLAMLLDARRLP